MIDIESSKHRVATPNQNRRCKESAIEKKTLFLWTYILLHIQQS